MIKCFYLIVYCTILCAINGCGFYLRGVNNHNYKFPYHSIMLDCNETVVCKKLTTIIKQQNLSVLTSDIKIADATIIITNEQTSRIAQNYNMAGRIAAYRLSYQVTLKVLTKYGEISDEYNIYSSMVMNYNDSTILANNINENIFWNSLHDNANNQIIRKIIYHRSTNK